MVMPSSSPNGGLGGAPPPGTTRYVMEQRLAGAPQGVARVLSQYLVVQYPRLRPDDIDSRPCNIGSRLVINATSTSEFTVTVPSLTCFYGLSFSDASQASVGIPDGDVFVRVRDYSGQTVVGTVDQRVPADIFTTHRGHMSIVPWIARRNETITFDFRNTGAASHRVTASLVGVSVYNLQGNSL